MKTAKRNWKTTLAGIATLALTGVGVWANPRKATDPNVIAAVVGAIGLIAARDASKERNQ